MMPLSELSRLWQKAYEESGDSKEFFLQFGVEAFFAMQRCAQVSRNRVFCDQIFSRKLS